jgi:2-polyprenyl-3-methyl-5-hydroxy-6-metoxy-1,4-benzoquinol methylase
MDTNSNTAAAVRGFFDRYATDFDAIYGTQKSVVERVISQLFRKSMRIRFDKVMEYANPVEGKNVLDVGCGPGLYSVILAKAGAGNVVGVDFADEMIQIARAKARELGVEDRCRFLTMDAMSYTSDRKADYVIVMGVMDYIEKPLPFLQHLMQLTDGKILLSFPVDDGLMAAQRKYRYRKRCPLYMYTEKSLCSLLDQAIDRGDYRVERISRDFFVTVTV